MACFHLALLCPISCDCAILLLSCGSFQPSMVLCLLKGTSKGVHSLLEENLTITREMLREAQLAYSRNSVGDQDGL